MGTKSLTIGLITAGLLVLCLSYAVGGASGGRRGGSSWISRTLGSKDSDSNNNYEQDRLQWDNDFRNNYGSNFDNRRWGNDDFRRRWDDDFNRRHGTEFQQQNGYNYGYPKAGTPAGHKAFADRRRFEHNFHRHHGDSDFFYGFGYPWGVVPYPYYGPYAYYPPYAAPYVSEASQSN